MSESAGSGGTETPGGAVRPPGEMRLRATRPPVTRLSRKVILGLSVIAVGGIGGALYLALKPVPPKSNAELYDTGNRTTPDGLANLPGDYTHLPRLGPPLPGDLGGPLLKAGVGVPGMATPAAPADPEKQRIVQEQEAARVSHLFTQTQMERDVAAPAMPGATAAQPSGAPADRKQAFLDGPVDHRTVSVERLTPIPSPYLLQAGAIIPGALITGIRSDLPGQVTAQVTENVYDSSTGHILLIPQGAKLIGRYDSQIAYGQTRVLLVWIRLMRGAGDSIVLENEPAADAAGYAGLQDQTDNHWGEVFKAALVSTILSVGSEADISGGNGIAQALRTGGSQGFNQIGEQIVGRSLNIQPTNIIRPGFPVRVMVHRDLVLTPYGQEVSR
ncbi:TrbI/VirB10 family protein [Gluconobacter sp. R75690]|uniref:TrbI/VirB10 family protein n=1 Tax=unclassified Gluconobacter TaxID=2644261 RepID=UPI00188AF237|nr:MULTISPECIES: TrbI/VirB10 family protein [unclassified Gluconobacter]MBF0851735.1 TrbI/VirB10 family protein [Gluconobacter sp. R75690]MBF0880448.1 TrbI/VirB10 family protein [Gluconobacter sp. R75828]